MTHITEYTSLWRNLLIHLAVDRSGQPIPHKLHAKILFNHINSASIKLMSLWFWITVLLYLLLLLLFHFGFS